MNHSKKDTPLHFVGIGGIGMSGIAEVFLNQGYPISGSDLQESESTRRLSQLGVRMAIGHLGANIGDAKVVVVSSAVQESNPEIQEARRRRIPVIRRAEMLGELMRGKIGVAVAGTHGKTTTTSMLATVLTAAGLDPTLVIGGKVDSLGGNAKLGRGSLVVAEADESDGSFLHLPATYGIITNIDNDHLDHYGSLTAVEDAFIDFVGKLPFYGLAAVCAEDAGVRRCMSRWPKPILTYGLSNEWEYYADELKLSGQGTRFRVHGKAKGEENHQFLGEIALQVPGKHNVLNALGTLVIALQLGLSFEDVSRGLAAFSGVKRRFETRWQSLAHQLRVIDDYGHHPTEIAATLSAARSVWKGRVLAVFQPHRYSRTLHCRDGFLSAFHHADVLYLTDIYAAGETPLEGVDSNRLAREIAEVAPRGQKVLYTGGLEETRQAVLAEVREGDLLLCMGAGSITRLPEQLISELERRWSASPAGGPA